MSTLATDTALRPQAPLEAAVSEGKEVWPAGPDRCGLTPDQVHVWRFALDLGNGGASRLEAILERVRTDGVDTILQTVEERVRAFRGSAEPFDDATMMALRIS